MDDYCLSEGSTGTTNPITLTLIILISINIGIELFRFITMLVLSNRERVNKRKLMIEENRIRVLEQLFKSMDSLTLLDRTEDQILLSQIRDVNQYIAQNKIYIPKEYLKISNDILDYFRNVLTDFRQKSVQKELELFEKFYNEFNK